MEEEIKNTEETQESQKTKQSCNILKYDYPVGRLQYILNCLLIFVIVFIISIIGTIIYYYFFKSNDYLPFTITIAILFMIFLAYLGIINNAKRLYDLLADKQKALFYTIVIYIINFVSGFIPVIKYIDAVFIAAFLIILLVVPGKLSK